MLACSSAGGGLRIAVVGNEALVTAEAGRRVALSSGGHVVLVLHGGLDADRSPRSGRPSPTSSCSSAAPTAATPRCSRATPPSCPGAVGRPGGGGRQRRLPAAGRRPAWRASRTPYVLADNVVPAHRRARPRQRPACDPRDLPQPRHRRQAPQQPHRRPRPRSPSWSAVPPPTSCCTGVELLAAGGRRRPRRRRRRGRRRRRRHHRRAQRRRARPRGRGLAREVVAITPVTRTVEGDLGMRWSAISTVETAGRDDVHAAARRREEPDFLPDRRRARRRPEVAAAAVRIALRRHAGRAKVVAEPRGPGRRAQRQGPAPGRPAGRLRRRAAPRRPRAVRRVLRPRPGRVRGRAGSSRATRGRRRPRLRAGRGRAARRAAPASRRTGWCGRLRRGLAYA